MNNWLNIIQNKLLPPRCILCEDTGFGEFDLCKDCFEELPRNLHCCYRCAESFDFEVTAPQLCGHCLSETPDFDDTLAPFLYQGHMRYLVTQLKFAQQYKNARLLGNLLAQHLASNAQFPESIIPMPLHINRYRERQFNQSIEIARHVSKKLAIPLDLSSCIRQRDTAHQTSLPAKQRHKNMHKAFQVIKPLNVQHVAILDDVMTTGASVASLAKVLKQSGISRVDVWVCARA
ncbi:ComF family protein [Methylomonas sp. AM2-LC]|uniref:ComF family protein n=1 Tax=Methylomonas sp. AM2-LC TaxID=3153301 RepID=UPI003264F192